ncbi:MAG TPA: hypothetical protein VLZ76_10985 [Lysobacter sp.]|nr:hypothetical protein [Lysobacter sp.]
MLLKVLKRALVLFLTLIGVSTAVIGALLRHHIRLANPCPTNDPFNSEPVTCFYQVQSIGDWLSALLFAF